MVATFLAAQMLLAACVPDPIRIRLTAAADPWRSAMPAVRTTIEQVWAPAGLRIVWTEHGEAWEDTDFWIAVLPGMSLKGQALGGVQFGGDRPQPLARLSLDAVLQWTRRYRSRLLGTMSKALESGAGDDAELVTRVLGYVAAHELGHFVLATKSHAGIGIMQPTFTRPELVTDEASWRVDRGSIKRLADRRRRDCPSPALRAGLPRP